MLYLVVNGGNGCILSGVLCLDVGDVLFVGGVVCLKSRDTALMVGKLIRMPGQLLSIGGDEFPVCQFCRFGAVCLRRQSGIGGIGLIIECIETPFGSRGAPFQSVEPPVLLYVLLLDMGDSVRVLGDFCFVFGKVCPESVGHRGEPFDCGMVVCDFLMKDGKLCRVVFELFRVFCQLLRIDCDVRGVVLNVLSVPCDVLRVLGQGCGLCIVDRLDGREPGILLPVFCLKCRDVRIIRRNLPLKVRILRFECGDVGNSLSLPGLKVRNRRVGVVYALCKSVHPGDSGRNRVLHLRIVLVILGDFLTKLPVIRCKPRNLFRQVFHLIFVLFDLCIVRASQRPVSLILDVNAGRHRTLRSVGLSLIGDDSQGLIPTLSVPVNRLCKLRDIPRPDVLRRPTARGRGRSRTRRARGMAGVAFAARCIRCRLNRERMTILIVCHIL